MIQCCCKASPFEWTQGIAAVAHHSSVVCIGCCVAFFWLGSITIAPTTIIIILLNSISLETGWRSGTTVMSVSYG